MDKVRFGIVGLGNQGNHYNNLLQDGKFPAVSLPLTAILTKAVEPL
ncbi:MAG: hypothetical protein IJY70_03750 [Clostridia bacterium]|nr:hypothetical protein [Clostridia bacterium]